MRSKSPWTALIILLVVVVGILSLLFPLRPEITPGGLGLDIEERDVLTTVSSVYRPELARFAVRFNDVVIPYRVMAMFVTPGERVTIEVPSPAAGSSYQIEPDSGVAVPIGSATWRWHAPSEPGFYPIHIDELATRFSVTLNVFVKTPYSPAATEVNGYRIGSYEMTPHEGDSAYLPPAALIEVTPENQGVLVSPHFTLGDFLCKQESDYPKYVLIREAMLLKLEMLLRKLNDRGIQAPTLHVMSAYRTPFYNRLIGNTTSYSRHLYGDAADVFVDRDGDGYMDDVTGDGNADRNDAVFMAEIVDSQMAEPRNALLIGGLGIYAPTDYHGPFIHVDVRGKEVHW